MDANQQREQPSHQLDPFAAESLRWQQRIEAIATVVRACTDWPPTTFQYDWQTAEFFATWSHAGDDEAATWERWEETGEVSTGVATFRLPNASGHVAPFWSRDPVEIRHMFLLLRRC